MASGLPPDLLERSGQEASRLLALSYLRQIDRARRRLADPLDGEALHDFRVGLRHLRSCIRAYRSQLKDSVSEKVRRRLRKLTRATNAARDTEVHLAWLRRQAERLGPEDAQGLFWLVGRLEGHKQETLDPATADVGRRFLKAAGKLRGRLATLRIAIPGKRQPTFGQVTGDLIQQQVARVRADLEPVRHPANVEEAHRARIAVKRLRYLLEPLARRVAGARAVIQRLKEIQDLLGDLHDTHVLSEEITSSLAALSGSPSDGFAERERGLRTLGRLAAEQTAATFERFDSFRRSERAHRLLARAEEVGRSLQVSRSQGADDTAGLRPVGQEESVVESSLSSS